MYPPSLQVPIFTLFAIDNIDHIHLTPLQNNHSTVQLSQFNKTQIAPFRLNSKANTTEIDTTPDSYTEMQPMIASVVELPVDSEPLI